MTRSEFGYFCAGVAAGAFGHAAYPQLKAKLAPYMAGAMVFAHQAFGDAIKAAMETAEAMQKAGDSTGPEVFAGPAVAESSEARGAA
jgi:hypothetical protein